MNTSKFPGRIYFFYGLLLCGCLILLGRLFELQIIFGAENRSTADGNRIRKTIDRAPRGIIFGANNEPLVKNVPIYRLKDKEKDEYKTISREEALQIEAKGGEEAERLRVDVGRNYPYGQYLVHVLGYLGEATADEVTKGEHALGDLIGRTGIEENYDKLLKGIDGGEIYEVNTQGVKIRTLGKIDPTPGEDIYLSIDPDLSRVAYQAMEGKRGAVVVIRPKTGEVLALVSSPSFDPEKITNEVLTDENKPLFNRSLSGAYPPGSLFKIVVATAGIQEGKISKDTLYNDTGFIQIGSYRYNNWYYTQYGRTEGNINLVTAIKRSTDTFFYKAGEEIGAQKIIDWAKVFGLGELTGIDLPGESPGLLPDPSKEWYLGNTYHLAIGQGDLMVTPLQANLVAGVIASGGVLCRPTILSHSTTKKPDNQNNCKNLNLKPETLKLIKEGMKEACSPGGTAYPFFGFTPQVACKTGTAEFNDPTGKTHAWFAAFAPADNPEIVVTAVVEGGGEGSAVAAPIVKKVMEAYFGI